MWIVHTESQWEFAVVFPIVLYKIKRCWCLWILLLDVDICMAVGVFFLCVFRSHAWIARVYKYIWICIYNSNGWEKNKKKMFMEKISKTNCLYIDMLRLSTRTKFTWRLRYILPLFLSLVLILWILRLFYSLSFIVESRNPCKNMEKMLAYYYLLIFNDNLLLALTFLFYSPLRALFCSISTFFCTYTCVFYSFHSLFKKCVQKGHVDILYSHTFKDSVKIIYKIYFSTSVKEM